MPGPVLTADEIAQLKKEKAKAEAAAATFTSQISALAERSAELAKVDSAFKKFFDYYDSDIIVRYDNERRQINGQYIDTPIVEADIINVANLQGGRLQPTLPTTDLLRIGQFDGTPILNDANFELSYINEQSQTETTLVSGYGGTTPAATIVTNSTITSASTTLQLTDPSTTFTIAPNSVYIVKTATDLAVIKILTFVMQVSPTPPPYVADCTIQVIVPPSGTIPTGKVLTAFNGFTNSERTTKTTVDPQMQPLMNYLVSQLQSKITSRISKLNLQLPEISTNQDPDGVSNLAQATTNVNASKTFLTSYLISTDISNTGLTSLSSERVTRTTQANARVIQINAAYTGQTKNYYNERYNSANNRGNTARGSLRLQKNAEQVSSASSGYATTLGDQASAIGSILP